MPRQANRHPRDRSESPELIQVGQRPVQLIAVVDSGTKYELGVKIDSSSIEPGEIVENPGALGISHQRHPQFRVGRMHRDVQWSDAFRLDTAPIFVRKIRQRDETAIEHRITEVVIHDIERLPHSFGDLLDETEGAGVFADAYAIERRIRERDPPVFVPLKIELEQIDLIATCHFQRNRFGLGVELEIDEIDDRSAIDGDDSVSRMQSELIGKGAVRHIRNQARLVWRQIDTTIRELTNFWGHDYSISVETDREAAPG